jgi:TatD DNase family protein
MTYFDAHIHLDKYSDQEIAEILHDPFLEGVLAVSMDLPSSQRTLSLKQRNPQKVSIACGFHPEQEIQDCTPLINWIIKHADEIDAIGEIGLPYYLRQEAEKVGRNFPSESYQKLLATFLELAKELNKPVVLHAVYEDARVACDLLEKYGIEKAHFHWIKTDQETLQRMAEQQYYISFTPDLLYKKKTMDIAAAYPLSLILVETDGPWSFEGPFAKCSTTPRLLPKVIEKLASLRRLPVSELEAILQQNIQRFLSRQ